jgi:hypothetical protein
MKCHTASRVNPGVIPPLHKYSKFLILEVLHQKYINGLWSLQITHNLETAVKVRTERRLREKELKVVPTAD